MRVLIVEDEADLARALRRGLEEEGFACDVALDGHQALYDLEQWDYDVILLDLMLPGVDGRTILERLRAEKPTPVLVLTARDAVADRVELLNAGADDYVTKPFEFAELVARVRALIRRAADRARPTLEVADVVAGRALAEGVRAGRVPRDAPRRADHAHAHLRAHLRRAGGHALQRRGRLRLQHPQEAGPRLRAHEARRGVHRRRCVARSAGP
jgi:CheY-like chemotaxis protein